MKRVAAGLQPARLAFIHDSQRVALGWDVFAPLGLEFRFATQRSCQIIFRFILENPVKIRKSEITVAVAMLSDV